MEEKVTLQDAEAREIGPWTKIIMKPHKLTVQRGYAIRATTTLIPLETERVTTANKEYKDLLRPSLPVSNSSMILESLCSPRERDHGQLRTNLGAFVPYKSHKMRPTSGNDGAQSNMQKKNQK